MEWLERDAARRLDPSRVLEGARSIVVAAMAYARPGRGSPPPPTGPDGPIGVVARYARGDDYHRVMGERLLWLERFIEQEAPGRRALSYVDTGPFLERMWAARAGIGWIGRNALVLNETMGSYFFLGVIVTTAELPADVPAVDQCGSCRLCVEACPTAAIVSSRVVDSRRCLSFHTIELRGPIPAEFRPQVGARLFGCDDCQEACPYNARPGVPAGPAPAFTERAGAAAPALPPILTMTRARYEERFAGSALRRAAWRGLHRNAAAALASHADGSRARPALEAVAADPEKDEVVREQAAWSAARLRAPGTRG